MWIFLDFFVNFAGSHVWNAHMYMICFLYFLVSSSSIVYLELKCVPCAMQTNQNCEYTPRDGNEWRSTCRSFGPRLMITNEDDGAYDRTWRSRWRLGSLRWSEGVSRVLVLVLVMSCKRLNIQRSFLLCVDHHRVSWLRWGWVLPMIKK
jgi:hypothetical protein